MTPVSLIRDVLPEGAVGVDSFVDLPGVPGHPEEEAVVAHAVAERQREFRTVRACARQALRQLGADDQTPLLPGEQGMPVWPAGVVGSLTHCAGYRAAAVARAEVLPTLGIDAEPHAPLPPDVLERVVLGEERTGAARLAAEAPATCWDRVLFCAKEAVYKAWFPVARTWLGFEDVVVALGADAFEARLSTGPHETAAGTITGFRGSFRVLDGLVVAAATTTLHTAATTRGERT